MVKKILCFSLAAAALSFNVYSQESQEIEEKQKSKTVSLQHEIVVTATRLETPAIEIASSVTVITREELKRLKKNTVIEVLQEISGVTVVQNGSSGGAASVFLRGANSEHTLVMLDGVEINDPISPSRSCDLSHLSLETIERIEILCGPQSTLYGSDAIGGIINIITKEGNGKPSVNITGMAGSYETYSGSTAISGSTEKIHYSLGASYLQNSGFSAASISYEGNEEKDGYSNFTLSGKVGYNPLDNLNFDLIIRTINTQTDIDNFGGAYGDDSNNTQTYNAIFLKCQMRTLLIKNRWEQKLGLSLVDYKRQYNNPTDELHPFDLDNSQYKSKFLKLDWQNNLFLHETNILTLGIEHQQEQGESEYFSDGLLGPSSNIFPLKKAHTTGIYIQDQIKVARQFFATVGIRLDNHSQFGKSMTFRLAPAYLVKKTGTRLKMTFGTGFKSPSLYQLYAPKMYWGPIGNKDLNPETCKGWDVGIEQQLMGNTFLLGAAYFCNIYKNLIQFDFFQGYTNIGQAESKGTELFVRARPWEGLYLNMTYNRTEAKDNNSDAYLLRRPKDKFSASLNLNFIEKTSIHLSIIYTGEREDLDFSTWPSSRVTMPGFTLINAVLSYELIKNYQIFLRLDNILNEKYEMIKGYGTPGFSIYLGFNLH